jgi:sulfur relay (sulfurtransferase) DsrF/TusC family protein
MAVALNSLALIVRSGPYRRRSARSQLDVALAAAALDMNLEVYFVGGALLQLAPQRDVSAALLPAGYRGWAGLAELADPLFPVGVYAEQRWLERCVTAGIELNPKPQALGEAQMRRRWRGCHRVLVL